MKSIILLLFAFSLNICSNEVLAQTKMILTMDGKESDIFGYAMSAATGSGSPQEMSVFGPMQNSASAFMQSYMSGQLIPSFSIAVTDAVTGTTTIKLTGVIIESLKQYTSTYTNGSFTISPSGNVNTEVLCKFQKLYYQTGTSTNNNEASSVTKSNPLLQGTTGRVFLDLPVDVECFIFIYGHNSNKEIAGASKDRTFYLAPGDYDIKVSSVKLEQIVVEKGKDTKIPAGVLNITSQSAWALFDANKKTRITGASKPGKIGLPAGNYQLQLGGSFQPVVIKDGETMNF